MVQEEIKAYAESYNVENMEIINDGIKSQLAIMEAIDKATFLQPECKKDEEIPAIEEQEIDEQGKTEEKTEKKEYVNEDKTVIQGYFNQNIRGGYIHKKESVFVPEKIIRELEIVHGDFLQATVLKNSYYTKRPEYYFEVIERCGNEENSPRKLEKLVVVKRNEELNRYYVDFKIEDEELPALATINESDALKFRLQEGDVIDYSHDKNKVIDGKVIWKYNIEELTKKKEKNKAKPQTKQSKVEPNRVKPIFEGVSILTVGGTNSNLHKNSKEEIEMRKGDYHSLSGDEQKATIVSRIKKADLVVVYTESISHEAMYLTKETCKKYEKVCGYTKSIGGIGLVRKLSEMKKKLIV
ncbi:TPA: DUF2325 domain-containing protein [Enterococcus faecium]